MTDPQNQSPSWTTSQTEPQNEAAWITAPRQRPLQVSAAPYPKPGRGQLVIKNHAVAVNPVDWRVQDNGTFLQVYPNILGEDVAGEVVEVGERADNRFSKGDRVIAYPLGLPRDDPAQGGFQRYTLVEEVLTAPIPPELPFEQAVVLPLAVSTAAAGLFQPEMLALELPSAPRGPPGPANPGTGKTRTILVWGAASAVGAAAVQLAVLSSPDVRVVATSSARNFEFVKSLGATEVVDYKSPHVMAEVVAAVDRCRGGGGGGAGAAGGRAGVTVTNRGGAAPMGGGGGARDVGVADGETETEGRGTFAGAFDAVGTSAEWALILQRLGGGRVVSTLTPSGDVPSGVEARAGMYPSIYIRRMDRLTDNQPGQSLLQPSQQNTRTSPPRSGASSSRAPSPRASSSRSPSRWSSARGWTRSRRASISSAGGCRRRRSSSSCRCSLAVRVPVVVSIRCCGDRFGERDAGTGLIDHIVTY
mgnify:CR=1 FL=1